MSRPNVPVHLLVHPLRLDRDVVEVRAAQHRQLALGALLDPRAVVAQPSGRLALPGHLDEQLQRRRPRRTRSRSPAGTPGRSGWARCRRARTSGRAGRASSPPVCRLAQRLPMPSTKSDARKVALPYWCEVCSPTMPGHQPVVVGDGAPAHQGRDDRHVEQLGQLDEQVGRVGVDDPATGDDQRRGRLLQHVEGLLDLRAGGGRPVRLAAARTCRGRTRSPSSGRRTGGRSAPARACPSA